MTMRAGIRTLLFTPGDNPRRVEKALDSGADAVVIDLEDAVHPDAKAEARRVVPGLLDAARASAPAILVRINAPDTAHGAEDLRALSGAPLDAVMVPKATPRMLEHLGGARHSVVALIETADGVERANEIARDPRVARLMLGSADLAADVGMELTADESELLYARSRVATASAAAGKEGPIDVVFLDLDDDEGLRRSAIRGRMLGYRAKACIHPRQLGIVDLVFAPTAEQIADALAILDAYEAGRERGLAVTVLGTRFIDLPVVKAAERVLAARRPSLDPSIGALK